MEVDNKVLSMLFAQYVYKLLHAIRCINGFQIPGFPISTNFTFPNTERNRSACKNGSGIFRNRRFCYNCEGGHGRVCSQKGLENVCRVFLSRICFPMSFLVLLFSKLKLNFKCRRSIYILITSSLWLLKRRIFWLLKWRILQVLFNLVLTTWIQLFLISYLLLLLIITFLYI